jgi:hypothetical protein
VSCNTGCAHAAIYKLIVLTVVDCKHGGSKPVGSKRHQNTVVRKTTSVYVVVAVGAKCNFVFFAEGDMPQYPAGGSYFNTEAPG